MKRGVNQWAMWAWPGSKMPEIAFCICRPLVPLVRLSRTCTQRRCFLALCLSSYIPSLFLRLGLSPSRIQHDFAPILALLWKTYPLSSGGATIRSSSQQSLFFGQVDSGTSANVHTHRSSKRDRKIGRACTFRSVIARPRKRQRFLPERSLNCSRASHVPAKKPLLALPFFFLFRRSFSFFSRLSRSANR